MKIIKVSVEGEEEISREQAKELLSRNYIENECTFDEMLEQNEYIRCMFCELHIEH